MHFEKAKRLGRAIDNFIDWKIRAAQEEPTPTEHVSEMLEKAYRELLENFYGLEA